MSDISGIGRTNSVHFERAQSAQSTEGRFGEHTVQVGQGEARGASALKTAWTEVKHFFKSLFGVRVSTPKPETVHDSASAAKGVLHEMTQSKIDHLGVVESLAQMVSHLPVPAEQDADRGGLVQGARTAFSEELGHLSDVQLLRLNNTFCTHPVFVAQIGQFTTGIAMEHAEDLMQCADVTQADVMRGAGKMADVGFLTSELFGLVQDEMGRRELSPRQPDQIAVASGEIPHEMQVLGEKLVQNFGDMTQAISDTRVQIADEHKAVVLDALAEIGIYEPPQSENGARTADNIVPQHLGTRGAVGADDVSLSSMSVNRDLALQDPRMRELSSGTSVSRETLVGFFTDHFDVATSGGFWDHFQAKASNPELFGATLSKIVIERTGEQGEITQKDVEDLQKILNFCGSGYQLPDDLAGPLDERALGVMGTAFFESFVGRDAPLPLNMYGDMDRLNREFNNPTATGTTKLDLAMQGYDFAWTVQVQLASEAVRGPVGAAR
jgi:hypothetical protein